jgi:hypothetical protein
MKYLLLIFIIIIIAVLLQFFVYRAHTEEQIKKLRSSLTGSAELPPENIPWTNCLKPDGSEDDRVQAQLVGGFIEFHGEIQLIPTTNTTTVILRMPELFPKFAYNTTIAIATRERGYAYRAGTIHFSADTGNITFSPLGRTDDVFLTGIRVRAVL